VNDLEELISGLLTERAEPVRLPADTAAQARARAHRSRRRHQWAAVATSALVVATVVSGTVLLVDRHPAVEVAPGAASASVSQGVASGPVPSGSVSSGGPSAAAAPCTAAVVVDGQPVWSHLVSHTIHVRVGSSIGLDIANEASNSGSPCGIVSSSRLGHDGVLADLTSPRPTAQWLAVGAGTADVSVSWSACRTCLDPMGQTLATYHLVVDPSPAAAPWPPCHVTFRVTEPGRTPRTLVVDSTEVSAGAKITVGIQGTGQCQIGDLAQTSAPGDSSSALTEVAGAWLATNDGAHVVQDQLAVVAVCVRNLDPLSDGGPCVSEPIVRSLMVVVRPRSASGG
jgi:hypothetical protein